MFDFKSMELERIRKNHDFKMQKMELKADLATKEENLKNRLESNKLNNRKGQLGLLDDIRIAKMVVSNDKKIIKAGKFLDFWATIGTIVSTLLTIAGLWHFYNTSILKSVSLILAVILTQFSVYILAKQTSNINKHFIQHAFKCSLLKTVLLIISVYGNYTFFTSSRSINFVEFITTLALCICIDVISIYVLSIAQDFKTLNKNCFKAKIQNNNSIGSKIKEIIVAIPENYINRLHRKVVKNTYLINEIKDNTKLPHDRIINDLEVKQEVKKPALTLVKQSNSVSSSGVEQACKISNNQTFTVKNLHISDTDRVLEYMKDNQRNGVVPSLNIMIKDLDISANKIREAKKQLKENGYIETLKNKTYLKKQRMEG